MCGRHAPAFAPRYWPAERVLDDVLAVQDRPHHARTVAVEPRPEVGDRLEKRQVARLEEARIVRIGWTIPMTFYACGGLRDTEVGETRMARTRIACNGSCEAVIPQADSPRT